MKYIKTYESATKYKIGDYVVAALDLTDRKNNRIPGKEKFFQIVDLAGDKYYRCKLLLYTEEDLHYAIEDQNIIRKIDEYEITAMQYNL